MMGPHPPNALLPGGLIFQYFCLMLWQTDGSRTRSIDSSDGRAGMLRAFIKKLFGLTDRVHPHMLVTRSLSLLNLSTQTPIEQPALDLGCETGITARLLFDEPFAYGVDISPQWSESIARMGMHGEYRVGSADAIPLHDSSVRSVVMNNVLYHVANRKHALEEVFRILQPGGKALFDDMSPLFFDPSNRPFIQFLRSSGGADYATEYLQRRSTMYMRDRTIDPADSLTPDQYIPFMESIGFCDVRAAYYFCPTLLRLAYNFLDMGFIFGSGAIEPHGSQYYEWAQGELVGELLRDAQRCQEGGGYIFISAKKPG